MSTSTNETTIEVPTVSAERLATAKRPVHDEDEHSGSSEAMVSATPPRRPSNSSSCSEEEDSEGSSVSISKQEMGKKSAGEKKRDVKKPPVHTAPRRKPSAEERASDAASLVSSWMTDLCAIAGAMQGLQAEVTARGACNESAHSLGEAHMAFVQLCGNAHIVAHNFLNAVIPSLPEQQVHEIGSLHEHSAIIGTFQQLIESVERQMDIYASFTRRLAEIGDLDRGPIAYAAARPRADEDSNGKDNNNNNNSSSSSIDNGIDNGNGAGSAVPVVSRPIGNPFVPAAVSACCFTAHYNLLRSLRAVVCQINILTAALERRAERLRALLAGKREKGRHAQLYF